MPWDKKLLALVAVALLAFAACGDDSGDSEDAGSAEPPQTEGTCYEEPFTTESGLVIEDVECGDGDAAEANMQVTVHYTGTLDNGEEFDSSVDREPFTFILGAGMVIQGWDEGVEGMAVGGKRTLTIPPELGYGAAGAGGVIPPNATLIFDIELLEVQEMEAQPSS